MPQLRAPAARERAKKKERTAFLFFAESCGRRVRSFRNQQITAWELQQAWQRQRPGLQRERRQERQRRQRRGPVQQRVREQQQAQERVREQQLLPSYRKQPGQQQRSRLPKRETCSCF